MSVKAQENLSPDVIRKIMRELKELSTNPPEDIKLLPNEHDITDIQALITGPADTPFEGGVFRVKLKLGPEFPQAPPKGLFLTKIFHPNVSKTGEICVNTLKKDWKEDLGIRHILLTIKCLLIVPNPESALNEEAGRLLLDAYEDYAQRARIWTQIHANKEKLALAAGSSAVSTAGAEAEGDAAGDTAETAVDGAPASPSLKKKTSSTGGPALKKSASKTKRSLKRL